jgi:hypothetical protein
MAWRLAYAAAAGPGPPASTIARGSKASGGGGAAGGRADGCRTTPVWQPCRPKQADKEAGEPPRLQDGRYRHRLQQNSSSGATAATCSEQASAQPWHNAAKLQHQCRTGRLFTPAEHTHSGQCWSAHLAVVQHEVLAQDQQAATRYR